MPNRTDEPPEQPTPVADDAHTTVAQLHTRADTDYADAQSRREQFSGEDRVHGSEPGGGH